MQQQNRILQWELPHFHMRMHAVKFSMRRHICTDFCPPSPPQRPAFHSGTKSLNPTVCSSYPHDSTQLRPDRCLLISCARLVEVFVCCSRAIISGSMYYIYVYISTLSSIMQSTAMFNSFYELQHSTNASARHHFQSKAFCSGVLLLCFRFLKQDHEHYQ